MNTKISRQSSDGSNYYPDDFESDDSLDATETKYSTSSSKVFSHHNTKTDKTKHPKVSTFLQPYNNYDDDDIENLSDIHNEHKKTDKSEYKTNRNDREITFKTDEDEVRLSRATTAYGSRAGTANRSQSKRRNTQWIHEGKWSLGDCLGKGSFGDVFQCMNDKGKLYAVKRIEIASGCSHDEMAEMVQEIETMRHLCHDNIVEYVGATVDENRGHLYIFQEWVSGGSLAHLLQRFGPFQEGVVQNYTRQILHGLTYLHENHIVHRDIKGGNILVDESGTVKLADFGASSKLTQVSGDGMYQTQELREIKGTPYFMAPEVLSENKYGRKGDIWAVGCTMVQMLTGHPPWKHLNLQSLVQLHMELLKWKGGVIPMPNRPNISVELHNCLEMCFQKNAVDRPTPEKLIECPFLRMSKDELEESVSFDYLNETNEVDHMTHLKSRKSSQSGNSSTHGGRSRVASQHHLDDTNNIINIKEKMERIMSQGAIPSPNLSPTNAGGNDGGGGAGGKRFSNPYISTPNLFKPQTPPTPTTTNSKPQTPNPPILKQAKTPKAQAHAPNIKQFHTGNDTDSDDDDFEYQDQPAGYSVNVPAVTPSKNNAKKNPFARSKDGSAYSPLENLSPEQREVLVQQLDASKTIQETKSRSDSYDTVLIDEKSIKEKMYNKYSNKQSNSPTDSTDMSNNYKPSSNEMVRSSSDIRRSRAGRHAILGSNGGVGNDDYKSILKKAPEDESPRSAQSSPRLMQPSPLAREYPTPTSVTTTTTTNTVNGYRNSNSNNGNSGNREGNRNFFGSEVDEYANHPHSNNNRSRNNIIPNNSQPTRVMTANSSHTQISGGKSPPRSRTANSTMKPITSTSTSVSSSSRVKPNNTNSVGSSASIGGSKISPRKGGVQPPSTLLEVPQTADGNNWKCLKCNFLNDLSLHYCDSCATVRGATGRRDNNIALPYR